MNRRFGARQSLLLAALVAVLASGCGQETSAPQNGLTSQSAALTQDHVIPTGEVCAPTGAHGKHATFGCATCHVCGGVLQFDPNGPAVGAGQPLPSFDATAKTCSNVACHSVPSGTFTYTTWDWGSESVVEVTVPYGGSGGAGTPSWYAGGGGVGCIGCHGNPPTDYSYTWHGSHGGGNQCELCHPDAVSSGGVATGLSTATNCAPNGTSPCAALHANGALDVTPKWKSTCLGCH
jgi:predicted CxxxxCH...CXXCH cytochrome family protein